MASLGNLHCANCIGTLSFPISKLCMTILHKLYSVHIVFVMIVRDCLSVCPQAYLRNYTSDFHQVSIHVNHVCRSVFLWRCCDTLRTSGFYGRCHMCT